MVSLRGEHWIVVDDEAANTESDSELPSKQNFGGANGGASTGCHFTAAPALSR